MGRGLHKQTDGHRPVPHIATGVASVIVTLVLSYFAHLGGTGAQGPAGPSGVTRAGVCAYFGPDAHGTKRFQVSTPSSDGGCTKGSYISVVPGK